MRKITTILILAILFTSCTSCSKNSNSKNSSSEVEVENLGSHIKGSIMHNGIQRDYILYIPAIYDGNTDVPLVLNFHGIESNATEQMFYGDFRDIADTEGFILVHPEGTFLNGYQHWNVDSFTPGTTTGSTADDVGFTEVLIDKLAILYTCLLTTPDAADKKDK